jgi:hypothetical protein
MLQAHPRPSLASWVLVLATLLTTGAACQNRPADCGRHETLERCLWERGTASPDAGTRDEDGNPSGNEGGGLDPIGELTPEATRLDATLSRMTEIIAAGLEWTLVDEGARALCSGAPEFPDAQPGLPDPTPDAWTCSVADLELGEQPLALEASHGVLSLSAVDLDDGESAELFELAQRRFDGWCAGRSLQRLESDALAEFLRCSLADGPYLVIARFPRDLEAGRWQISIAIVDAG